MPAVISSISVSTSANSTIAAPRGGEGRRSRYEFIASAVKLDFRSRDRFDQAGEFDVELLRAGRVGHFLHEEFRDADHLQCRAITRRDGNSAVDHEDIEHPAVARAGV